MPKTREPRPPRGRSDLVKAVKSGDLDQVTTIINGAKNLAKSELLAQGLTVACEQRQLAVAQRLTSLGADPSAAFASKQLPLLIAVDLDQTDLVKHLLAYDNHHADFKVRQAIRRNALMTARSRPVGQAILSHGLDIHSRGKEQKTLLMDVRCAAVAELLLDQGARLEDVDEQGRTALGTAIEYDDDPLLATTLVKRGADIEAKDNEGRNVLTTAIWKSRIDILKLLIQRGVQTTACDHRGRNALHHLASDKRRNYEYHPQRQSGRRLTQQDRDQQIIDLLLKTQIDPAARDHRQRTCIHWAAAMGNSGLLKMLLRTSKFDVNAVERRGKGALHFAVASSCVVERLGKGSTAVERYPNGHFNAMLVLLDHGANTAAQADGDWTPLHNACWNAADTRATVGVLLRHSSGLGRHTKTRNGRTPLHIAAHAGNVEVVRYLLRRKDTKRSLRDIFGNTPFMYAVSLPRTSAPQRKTRDAMMDLFAPWNNGKALSTEAREAATMFEATIVDFDCNTQSKASRSCGHAPKKVSVFDLLYDPASARKYASAKATNDDSSFRWVHLPANNVSWCLDLITNHFVASRSADAGSFKALERSFNHQHRGEQLHSNYMTPMCQTVLHTEAHAVNSWDAESELQRGMSQESTLTDEDHDNPQRTIHALQSILGGDSIALTNEPRPLSQSKPSVRSAAFRGQAQRETPKQSDHDTVSISDAYLFMPYLYYETQQHREKMGEMHKRWQLVGDPDHDSPSRRPQQVQRTNSPTGDRHDVLFDAHSQTPEALLHVRRTLDQFFYHNIDTEKRDNDQVLHRYQGVVQKIEPHLHKVLMVDQLWMWVLGKDLVVTSFPQRRAPPLRDPLDIHENILAILNSGGGERVRNVFELAMIIVGRCYGAYDRHGLGSQEPQFLDMYEGWIGAVMDDEVQLFEQFKEDSENASKWLGNPLSLREIKRREKKDEKLKQNQTAKPTAPKRKFTVLSSREEVNTQRHDFVENLLDIGSETALLGEVKDIADELHMLSLVFQHQLQVLPSMESAMKEIWAQEKWSTAVKRRIEKGFEEHRRTITYPQTDVERMEKQTRRIYKSITDLLDLKQKHANAIEARYAREQTDDASRQGQTFMVFTTVTVIFLPLSFIAAFFAIDMKELPHDQDGELSLGFVSRYTFGVGLSVALFCVFMAIYAEDVAFHFKELVKKALARIRVTTTEAQDVARTKWQQRQQEEPDKASSETPSQEKVALYEEIYQPHRRKSIASVAFGRKGRQGTDLEVGKPP